MPIKTKTDQNQNSDKAKRHAHQHAKLPGSALRLHRCGESPFAKEIPDADTQMERRSENANGEKGELQRIF